MKSYTDLEQSKRLAEILSLESADMKWLFWKEEIDAPKLPTFEYSKSAAESYKNTEAVYLPCWSFAALGNVLSSRLFDSTPKRKELYLLPDLDKSYCFYRQFAVKTKGKIYLLTEGECLVDACYEMIIKLNELNLL